MSRSISAPISGWVFISANSSSSSGPALHRIPSDTPILPTSWRIAPYRMSWRSSYDSPMRSATATDRSLTRSA